jgi:single-stranded DNA-specific DHH superfamily exonuclease
MILNSKEYNAKTVLGLANRDENNIKVSCRTIDNINVGMILKEACEKMSCTGGGHKFAGGALIKSEKVEEFIDYFSSKVNESRIKQ